MKFKYTIYVIVLLCIADICMLYLYCRVCNEVREYENEVVNLREFQGDLFHKYDKARDLEMHLRDVLHKDSIEVILAENRSEDNLLLVVLPRNTCWSCVEEELQKVLELNKDVFFICPENLKNGIKLLSHGKAKTLSVESILELDKLDSFPIVYMSMKKGELSVIYIPLFGTDWTYVKKLVN